MDLQKKASQQTVDLQKKGGRQVHRGKIFLWRKVIGETIWPIGIRE